MPGATWVIAIWWNEPFGAFQSAGFPVAMVDGPITLPPVNVRPQTGPTDRSDHPPGGATPGGPTEGSDHPPGDLSSTGQPNQNPTVQSINQTRQVRPVNATTLGSPSTRPARILPSQQGAGPLQQGTGTDQTIGVPQLRPALALPLQTGHRAQSDGITIATGHQCQSDNWHSAGEARAGIATGHRPDGITITIATRHRYQSDNRRWAGEASQRGHVNARSGCDR